MVKVLFNKETGKFDVVDRKVEGAMYLDGYLKTNLDFITDDVRQDSDAVIVVSGKERSGKSVLAMQVGYYLDPTLTLDRVCFNPGEFKKQVLAAKKYTCVIYDEAVTGMRAVRWSNEVNQALVELLAQIGQKNLIIILVIPSFFELGKYSALHRSVALLQVHRSDGKRGFFKVYDENKKVRLYMLGKKLYDYSVTNPNFYGRFTNKYVLDETAYRAKKYKALTEVSGDEFKAAQKFRAQRDGLIKYLYNEQGISQPKISLIIGSFGNFKLGQRQISAIIGGEKGGV